MPRKKNPGDIRVGAGSRSVEETNWTLTPGKAGKVDEADASHAEAEHDHGIGPGGVGSSPLKTHIDDETGAHPAASISIDGNPGGVFTADDVEGALDELSALIPPKPPKVGYERCFLDLTGIPDWGVLKLTDASLLFRSPAIFTHTSNPPASIYPYYWHPTHPAWEHRPFEAEGKQFDNDYTMAGEQWSQGGDDPWTDHTFNIHAVTYSGGGAGLTHAGAFTRSDNNNVHERVDTVRIYPAYDIGTGTNVDDNGLIPVVLSGMIHPADRGLLALIYWPPGGDIAAFMAQDLAEQVPAAILLGQGILGQGCPCDGDPGGIFLMGEDENGDFDPYEWPGAAAGQSSLQELHSGIRYDGLIFSQDSPYYNFDELQDESKEIGSFVLNGTEVTFTVTNHLFDEADVVSVRENSTHPWLNTDWIIELVDNDHFLIRLGEDVGSATVDPADGKVFRKVGANKAHYPDEVHTPYPGQVRLGTDPQAGQAIPNGIPILGAYSKARAGGNDNNFFRYRLPYLNEYSNEACWRLKWTPTSEKGRYYLKPAVALEPDDLLAQAGDYPDFTKDYWPFQLGRYRHRFLINACPCVGIENAPFDLGSYVLVHFKKEVYFEDMVARGEMPTKDRIYSAYLAHFDDPEHVSNAANAEESGWQALIGPDFNRAPWSYHVMRASILADMRESSDAPTISNAAFDYETVGDNVMWVSGVAYFHPTQADGTAGFWLKDVTTSAAGLWANNYRTSDHLQRVLNTPNPALLGVAPFSYTTHVPDWVDTDGVGKPRRQRVEFDMEYLLGAVPGFGVDLAPIATAAANISVDTMKLSGDAAFASFSSDAHPRAWFRRPLGHTTYSPASTVLPTIGVSLMLPNGLKLLNHSSALSLYPIFGNFFEGGIPLLSLTGGLMADKPLAIWKDSVEWFLDESYRYSLDWSLALNGGDIQDELNARLAGPGLPYTSGNPQPIEVPVRAAHTPTITAVINSEAVDCDWNNASWLQAGLHEQSLTVFTDPGEAQVAGLPDRNPPMFEGLQSPFPARGILLYPQTSYTGTHRPLAGEDYAGNAQPDYSGITGDRGYVRCFNVGFSRTDYGSSAAGQPFFTLRLWGLHVSDIAYMAPGPGSYSISVQVKVPGLTTWMDLGRPDGAGPSKQDPKLDGAGCLVRGPETKNNPAEPVTGLVSCDLKVNVGPVANLFESTGHDFVAGEVPVLIKVVLKDRESTLQGNPNVLQYDFRHRWDSEDGDFDGGPHPDFESGLVRGLVGIEILHPEGHAAPSPAALPPGLPVVTAPAPFSVELDVAAAASAAQAISFAIAATVASQQVVQQSFTTLFPSLMVGLNEAIAAAQAQSSAASSTASPIQVFDYQPTVEGLDPSATLTVAPAALVEALEGLETMFASKTEIFQAFDPVANPLLATELIGTTGGWGSMDGVDVGVDPFGVNAAQLALNVANADLVAVQSSYDEAVASLAALTTAVTTLYDYYTAEGTDPTSETVYNGLIAAQTTAQQQVDQLGAALAAALAAVEAASADLAQANARTAQSQAASATATSTDAENQAAAAVANDAAHAAVTSAAAAVADYQAAIVSVTDAIATLIAASAPTGPGSIVATLQAILAANEAALAEAMATQEAANATYVETQAVLALAQAAYDASLAPTVSTSLWTLATHASDPAVPAGSVLAFSSYSGTAPTLTVSHDPTLGIAAHLFGSDANGILLTYGPGFSMGALLALLESHYAADNATAQFYDGSNWLVSNTMLGSGADFFLAGATESLNLGPAELGANGAGTWVAQAVDHSVIWSISTYSSVQPGQNTGATAWGDLTFTASTANIPAGVTGVLVEYDANAAAGSVVESSTAPNLTLKYGPGVQLSALMDAWANSNLIPGTEATFVTAIGTYDSSALAASAEDGFIQTIGHFSLELVANTFAETPTAISGEWTLVTQDFTTSWSLMTPTPTAIGTFAVTQTVIGPATVSPQVGIQIEYDASVADYSGTTVGDPGSDTYQIKYGDITLATLMGSIDSDPNLQSAGIRTTVATLDEQNASFISGTSPWDMALKQGDNVIDFDEQAWGATSSVTWTSLPVFVAATWTILEIDDFLRLGHEVDPAETRSIQASYDAARTPHEVQVSFNASSGLTTITYGANTTLSELMMGWELYVSDNNLSSPAAVTAGNHPAEVDGLPGLGDDSISGAELVANGGDIPLLGITSDTYGFWSRNLPIAVMGQATVVTATQTVTPYLTDFTFTWDMPEEFDNAGTVIPAIGNLEVTHTAVPTTAFGSYYPYGQGISITHDSTLSTSFGSQITGIAPNQIVAITYNDSQPIALLMAHIKTVLEALPLANGSTVTVTLGGVDANAVQSDPTANVMTQLGSQRLLFDTPTSLNLNTPAPASWGYTAAYNEWQVAWTIGVSGEANNPNQDQSHELVLSRMSVHTPEAPPPFYSISFEYDSTAAAGSVNPVQNDINDPTAGVVWKYGVNVSMMDLMYAIDVSASWGGSDTPSRFSTLDGNTRDEVPGGVAGDFTLVAYDSEGNVAKALFLPAIQTWDSTDTVVPTPATWDTV